MADTALFRFSYGVYLLTTRVDGRDNGCIINTAMQVSDNPQRVLVVVNRNHLTHDMLARVGSFNLCVLSTDAPFALYQRFGLQSGRQTDKFADFSAVKRAENGVYYLTEGANAYLSATVESTVNLGSHTLFLARVGESGVLNAAPSATYAYYRDKVKPPVRNTGGYVCRVCGYRYPGETLPPDFVCPICGHGTADFEAVS